MPFKSKAQAHMMQAAAHNPAFAKKVGVPVTSAKKMVEHAKGQPTKNLPQHATGGKGKSK